MADNLQISVQPTTNHTNTITNASSMGGGVGGARPCTSELAMVPSTHNLPAPGGGAGSREGHKNKQ
eukprot:scaffold69750_cov35-Cyclotella_meneghiniana.AAC.1